MYRYRYAYQTPTTGRGVDYVEAECMADARALARGRLRSRDGLLGRVENIGKVKAERLVVHGWAPKVPTGPLSVGAIPRDGLDGELVGTSERNGDKVVYSVDEQTYLRAIEDLQEGYPVRLDIDPRRIVSRRPLTLGDYGYNND